VGGGQSLAYFFSSLVFTVATLGVGVTLCSDFGDLGRLPSISSGLLFLTWD
jgi:hypothetical protein